MPLWKGYRIKFRYLYGYDVLTMFLFDQRKYSAVTMEIKGLFSRANLYFILTLVAAFFLSINDVNADYYGNPKGYDFYPKIFYGAKAKISQGGVVIFDRINPSNNQVEEVRINQIGVKSIPKHVLELVSDKPVTCTLVMEYEGIQFGACSFFIGGSNEKATEVLMLISELAPKLLGCAELEARARQKSNDGSCKMEAKK